MEPDDQVMIDVLLGAPGYDIQFIITIFILLLQLIVSQRRSTAAAKQHGHCAKLLHESIMQFGYTHGRFGWAVKWISIIFIVWIQLSMVITIAAHYSGVWVWTHGETRNATWDSFARSFLLAWIVSIAALALILSFRRQMQTFYLKPCPLIKASHVAVIKKDTDESGNVITTHNVSV